MCDEGWHSPHSNHLFACKPWCLLHCWQSKWIFFTIEIKGTDTCHAWCVNYFSALPFLLQQTPTDACTYNRSFFHSPLLVQWKFRGHLGVALLLSHMPRGLDQDEKKCFLIQLFHRTLSDTCTRHFQLTIQLKLWCVKWHSCATSASRSEWMNACAERVGNIALTITLRPPLYVCWQSKVANQIFFLLNLKRRHGLVRWVFASHKFTTKVKRVASGLSDVAGPLLVCSSFVSLFSFLQSSSHTLSLALEGPREGWEFKFVARNLLHTHTLPENVGRPPTAESYNQLLSSNPFCQLSVTLDRANLAILPCTFIPFTEILWSRQEKRCDAGKLSSKTAGHMVKWRYHLQVWHSTCKPKVFRKLLKTPVQHINQVSRRVKLIQLTQWDKLSLRYLERSSTASGEAPWVSIVQMKSTLIQCQVFEFRDRVWSALADVLRTPVCARRQGRKYPPQNATELPVASQLHDMHSLSPQDANKGEIKLTVRRSNYCKTCWPNISLVVSARISLSPEGFSRCTLIWGKPAIPSPDFVTIEAIYSHKWNKSWGILITWNCLLGNTQHRWLQDSGTMMGWLEVQFTGLLWCLLRPFVKVPISSSDLHLKFHTCSAFHKIPASTRLCTRGCVALKGNFSSYNCSLPFPSQHAIW